MACSYVIVFFAEIKRKPRSGKKQKPLDDNKLSKIEPAIIKDIGDPGSRLYLDLLEEYKLSKVEACSPPLQLTMWPLSKEAMVQLIQLCNEGELGLFIHERVEIQGVSKAWEIELRPDTSCLDLSLFSFQKKRGEDSGFLEGPVGSGWVKPISGTVSRLTDSGVGDLQADSASVSNSRSVHKDILYEDGSQSDEDTVDSKPTPQRQPSVFEHPYRWEADQGRGSHMSQSLFAASNVGLHPKDDSPISLQGNRGLLHYGQDFGSKQMATNWPYSLQTPGKASPELTAEEFRTDVVSIIKNRHSIDFDLIVLLRSNPQHKIAVVQDDTGNFVLHQCVIHNRINFLRVLFFTSSLPSLIEQKVPASSQSEAAGCTPKELATKKRLRRFNKELEKLEREEKTFSQSKKALSACRSGELSEVVAYTIDDLMEKDVESSTTLHYACMSGSLPLVKFLVSKGLKPDVVNVNSQTPLHIAVHWGHSSLLPFIIENCKVDYSKKDKTGKTLLQITAENGDISSLSELLRSGVPLESDLHVRAAHFGRDTYLKYLLETHGLDPAKKEDTSGRTCLMAASEFGHLSTVKYLLNNFRFKIDEVSTQERNVFHYAADNGHVEVAKVLLDFARDKGYDVPKLLNQKDVHKVDRLCSMVRGIDKGRPAWHYVHLKRKCVHIFQKNTKRGRVDASKMGTIIRSGWGEGIDAEQLKEALHNYVQGNRTKSGLPDLSPLALSISRGQTAVAKLYIEAGANVDTRDCFGQTLLHLAAMRGLVEITELLKGRVPDKELDEERFTAYQVAELNEQTEVMNILRAGVDECETLVEKFINDKVKALQDNLSSEKLQELRRSGKDIVRHVVDSVRDLQIDINLLLQDIGSGPVLEETREGADYSETPVRS